MVGLAAWLSTRYTAQFDWTAGGRNTLSEASAKVLDLIKEPVTVTSYAREGNRTLRDQVSDLIGRYSRRSNNVSLAFVNPDTNPDQTREMGITLDGEMVIAYQAASKKCRTSTKPPSPTPCNAWPKARNKTWCSWKATASARRWGRPISTWASSARN
ncbi:DUF7088 domain-containing protein [Methylogaea oryzae]|uniref:DUF7088 domain-containing protein n=1 Tax=Methylogaea oryzae TaxID=1295382 RepID=UPI0020D0B910|nr:Gldg family protein [Methylogaea oryzae]